MSDYNAPPDVDPLEHFLATVIKRRLDVSEERDRANQNAQTLVLLVLGQERDTTPQEDVELRKYLEEMRVLGAEIVGLDERIEEIRAAIS